MKSKAKSNEETAAPKSEAPVDAAQAAAPKPAATTEAAKPAPVPVPKPGADKAKLFGKPVQQKSYMPPRGGKGGGGAIRQMRSQRGR